MNIFSRPKPKWSANLCGCGNDLGTCENYTASIHELNVQYGLATSQVKRCITCCLPCVTYGRIAEILDEGRSSCITQGCVYGLLMLISCHWLLSCVYREKLRAKFGLPAEPCCDCCVHFCCEYCALCQEHAELKDRGLDPSKGWTSPPNPLRMFK